MVYGYKLAGKIYPTATEAVNEWERLLATDQWWLYTSIGIVVSDPTHDDNPLQDFAHPRSEEIANRVAKELSF